jgi:Calcineurin-like phosphoesterase
MEVSMTGWRQAALGHSRLVRAIAIASGIALAAAGAKWPRSSHQPVAPLKLPTLESRLERLTPDASAGFEFVAFGDQRAQIGGEGEALFRAVGRFALEHDRLLLAVDTGDIVDNGAYSDQFNRLSGILEEIGRLAYLVAVGNHEVDKNRTGPARENTARFLSSRHESLSADRLYYRKIAGRVRFLFLDTNDLVYRGEGRAAAEAADRRVTEQMNWLLGELADSTLVPGATTVVVMHHPIVQSSSKHRDQARGLWNYRFHGRQLPDILADGGVDLILTGHTHTYERFTITRRDGRGFTLVNLSGKPESSFLWIGAAQRRAQNIQGHEAAWLYGEGWTGLENWKIVQEDVMTKNESDQFGVFEVDKTGGVSLSMHFLGQPSPEIPVRLLWGQASPTGPQRAPARR